MCKIMDDLRIESEKRGEKIGLEKGLKRGEKRGLRKGEIKGLVEACQELGKTLVDTISMVCNRFKMTESASAKIVAEYWKA